MIGWVMGLLGGGGAILAVPILVYLLHVEESLATAYSLFIVGSTALVGSLRYWKNGNVDYKSAIYFLIPSVVFVYLTRLFLVPAIPAKMHVLGIGFEKGTLLMSLFAGVMILAGVSMIRGRKETDEPFEKPPYLALWVSLWGTLVGFLAGLLGAGGGFMIVPVLVLFMRLPMKTSVGTSLVIIAGQSLTGFLGAVQAHQQMEWNFLLRFTALAFAGMLVGSIISQRSQPEKLKGLFGYFVLLMGGVIIFKEIFY